MKLQTVPILLSLIAANAAQAAGAAAPVATSPVAQTAVQSATAKVAPKRVAPAAMSVTRVTRQPDGKLAIDCVQQPNSRAHIAPGAQP